MKIVFNLLFWFGLAVVTFTATSEAKADQTYFTPRSVLASFFPDSDKVSFKKFTPSKAQRAQLKRRLGYSLPRSTYNIFVASSNVGGTMKVDGYAFIDDVMGQHRPITFAVKVNPAGAVTREEIMVYRESHGSEIRSARFRKQFYGKTVDDSMRPNKDIDCVSGATISSAAITLGVRRALVLVDASREADTTIRVSQATK